MDARQEAAAPAHTTSSVGGETAPGKVSRPPAELNQVAAPPAGQVAQHEKLTASAEASQHAVVVPPGSAAASIGLPPRRRTPRCAEAAGAADTAANSTAELATALAAAHRAHMRTKQAKRAAQARWKKHRQNSSAAPPVLTAGVTRTRQRAVLRRTSAPRVPSAAANQPAGAGTTAILLRRTADTPAAARGNRRLPAPEERGGEPAIADGSCAARQFAGDSEHGPAPATMARPAPAVSAAVVQTPACLTGGTLLARSQPLPRA